MEFQHDPVMFKEVLENLTINKEGTYVDGTLGGGGHASGICKNLTQKGTLIGIDRDIDAIQASQYRLKEYICKKIYIHDNYANIKDIIKNHNLNQIEGAVLDLGVSSFQLDNEKRGFSYMKEASLDMRMNAEDSLTAQDIINDYSEDELKRIIKEYGEEKWASRIAGFIVKERKNNPIKTTSHLVNIIKAAIPASARRTGPHPAKRTFQALRIEVNNELGLLEEAIYCFIDVLATGGRLCIITFHSLEDRIVKKSFNEAAKKCTCPPNVPICTCCGQAKVKKISGKPIYPSESEIESNPRSRSAKLRVVEKV